MSRSSYDFNFLHAAKPCSHGRIGAGEPECYPEAENHCPYFSMCDLPFKNPPKAPTVDWRTIKKLTFG